MFFRSDRECYLYLFDLGTSGSVTVLLPNQLHQDNFIRAGRIYAIPGNDYPFEYKLGGPAGIERIKAIATVTKKDLLDLDLGREAVPFHSSERSAAARDVTVVQKRVQDLPLDCWAEATCEFAVEA